MKHLDLIRQAFVLAVAGLSLGPACAADWKPERVFVELGAADHGSYVATLGVIWPWSWERAWLGGKFSGSTEAFASHLNVRAGAGREGYTLLGLVPLVRYRFMRGHSPWFVEAGIGVSALDSEVRTPDKQLGSAFNFYDVLAVGRSFGRNNERELSMRVSHVSNGNLKQPNPGENLVQLRYAARF